MAEIERRSQRVLRKLTVTYRHLKCDNDSESCRACQRAGEVCERVKNNIKFRHGSSARYDSAFRADQVWLSTMRKGNFNFIDETYAVVSSYDREGDENTESEVASEDDAQPLSQELSHWRPAEAIEPYDCALSCSPSAYDLPPNLVSSQSAVSTQSAVTRINESGHPVSPPTSHFGDNNDISSALGALPLGLLSTLESHRKSSTLGPALPADPPSALYGDSYHSPGPSADFSSTNRASLYRSDANSHKQQDASFSSSETRLEATLLRYFIEEIAQWFDICDPERHFALVVPQRARTCPSLLHAILTASSRHFTSLPKFKNEDGCFSWKGISIPGLNQDTALYYHDCCIKELMRMSGDPQQINNENLLAAAIVLRFYEEIDCPLQNNDDKGVLLRVLNICVNAQLPTAAAFPHSLLEIYHSETLQEPSTPQCCLIDGSPAESSQSAACSHCRVHSISSLKSPRRFTQAAGLRRACFWVAFRQELYTSFMKHRPFTLPLSRWNTFRTFAPAEDGGWADRLVLFCADVLDYCYGSSDTHLLASTDKDRWYELSRYLEGLPLHLPPSFEPIYFREPDMMQGEIFPEIWFADGCHATGTAHLELAKMLLAVFDPTRPKLGHGHMAEMRKLSFTLRSIVARLCGIALHNRRSPSVFVDACMGISACGEYFNDERERMAVLEVLRMTEVEYAWPTGSIATKLRQAWDAD